MSSRQRSRHRRRREERGVTGGGANRKWWIGGGIAVVAAVALLAGLGLSRNPEVSIAPSAGASAGPGAVADVVLQDFDGNPVTVSGLQGRPAVVNFWASWCPACYAEMPAFEKVYQNRGDSVQFLGINLGDDIESARQVVEQTGVTYPLARDPQGEVFAGFGGYGMPTTLFLDAEGRVVELYTGELTASELDARIEKYFKN